MKKLTISLLTMLFSLMANAESPDIIVNEEYFPDVNFRYFLLNEPYGKDGIITDEEILSITSLQISNKRISDLRGIGYFMADGFALHCQSADEPRCVWMYGLDKVVLRL